MKYQFSVRRAAMLGATTLLLAFGCGEGGSGAFPSTGETPFSSTPPSNDGVPSSGNNPFSGQQPTGSGLGSNTTPPSNQGPQTAPPADGTFQNPGGSGGPCVGSLKGVYTRCGLTDKLNQNPQAAALVDDILGQICTAIQKSPSCYSCFQANISTIPCTNVDDDDTNDDKSFDGICNSACSDVDIDIDIGFGGNGQGGSGQGGGNQGGNGQGATGGTSGGGLCGKCPGIASACPQFGSACTALCSTASKPCEKCIEAAGTDCTKLNQCGAVCVGSEGGGGSGATGGSGSGATGGTSGGSACAQLVQCCVKLDPSLQSDCLGTVQSGNDAACQSFLSTCPAQ